jgi:hypothetical protein
VNFTTDASVPYGPLFGLLCCFHYLNELLQTDSVVAHEHRADVLWMVTNLEIAKPQTQVFWSIYLLYRSVRLFAMLGRAARGSVYIHRKRYF